MNHRVLLPLLVLGILLPVRAAEPPPAGVVYLDHAKVDGAFSQGLPLVANNDRYKIHASRRVVAGVVEVHEKDTDIFYMVEGSATLVTGGTLVEPKTVGPGEIRARETTGGTTYHLAKGDFVLIPMGVPHWFKEVDGPCLYFVVRVTE